MSSSKSLSHTTHRYALRPRKVPGTVERPPSTSRLSTEIIYEIIEYAKDDLHHLASVSLINIDWLPVARRILFGRINIRFDQLDQFIRLVASPYCSLTPHVRKLQFRQVPRWQWTKPTKKNFNIFVQKLSKIVQLLPNVNWICLKDFDFHSECHAICESPYPGLDRIETLVLDEGMFDALPYAIEEVFTAFPRIRSLQCHFLSHRDHELVGRKRKPRYSLEDLTRRSSTNFLPELVDLSIKQPTHDVVAVINSCLSLQHVQRLAMFWYLRSDIGKRQEETELDARTRSLFTMIRLMGTSLEHVEFWGWTIYAYCNHSPQICWGFQHNFNLHTLVLDILPCNHAFKTVIGRLLCTINAHNLRKLVLNLVLYHEPILAQEEFLPNCRGITEAFERRPEVYGQLERVICCVEELYEEDTREHITEVLKKLLDPQGRLGLWERGVLVVEFQ